MTGARGTARIRALICEDEPLGRRAIRTYLDGIDWVELVGEARDGAEALRLIHKLEPDLVFLDVRMPEMTGTEVLDALTHRPAVVFTTAHEEYALSAFQRGAVDYLVKPFGRERFVETLARVRTRLVGEGLLGRSPRLGNADPAASSGGTHARRLFAERRGATAPVAVEALVRIEAEAGGSRLVTRDGTFLMGATLTELEARLDPTDFVRVHRSHIVNLSRVETIRRYDERRLELRLADGSRIVTSRSGAQRLKARIGP